MYARFAVVSSSFLTMSTISQFGSFLINVFN